MNSGTYRWRSSAFSWLLVLSTLATSSVGANSDRRPEIPAVADSALEDYVFIATEMGISPEEAIDRFAWQDDFALSVDTIRNEFPDAFARAEITGSRQAGVVFRDEAPSGALDIIDAFRRQHDVSVDVVAALGFNEVELGKAIEAAHFAVFEHPDVREAVTDFDFDLRRIVSTVVLELDADDSILGDLRSLAVRRVGAAFKSGLSTITVSVARSEQESISVDYSNTEHLGGETLFTWQLVCTSGFVTRTNAGVRGISTAGHCDDVLFDDSVQLTFMAQHVGSLGDFQWHRGSQSLPNAFYSGSSTTTEANRRNVTAASVPVINQANLCHNGAETHRQCTMTVTSITACNGTTCGLIRMNVNRAFYTDSGGPLFASNTAYGLVQGAVLIGGVWRGTYSRLDRMYNALGITVATS